MKSLTLLTLILSISLISADYTLPDLGVTQDTITCGNIDSMTAAANNDVTRLTSLIQQTIPSCIALLEQVHTLVDKAHDLASNVKHLSNLLQTNTESSMMTSFKAGAAEFESDVNKMEDNPISAEFKAKLGEIIDQMNQMATGVTKSDINAVYTNLVSTVVEMEKYLNWQATAIQSQWIDGYLTPRQATLSTFYTRNCLAVMASGTYSATVPSTSTLASGATRTRSETFTVNFPTAFGNTPSVALALAGWDLASSYPSLVATVSACTTTGFTATITVASSTVVRSFAVNWIAIDRRNVNARVSVFMIDYKDSSNSNLPTTFSNSGAREYTRRVSHNAGFADINTLSFISGFSFDGVKANNLIVSTSVSPVDGNSYDLKIQTNQDTYLYTAVATGLSYDKTGLTQATNNWSSSNGAGSENWNYGWTDCSNAIVNFNGVTSLSYAKGNINFSSRFSTTSNGASLTYSVNSATLSVAGTAVGFCNPRIF